MYHCAVHRRDHDRHRERQDGREIKPGDIVKVYHFTGARRKRYYMYKQALGISRYLPSGTAVMKFSHLNMDDSFNGSYEDYGPKLKDYEIVQGAFDDHEDRERVQ